MSGLNVVTSNRLENLVRLLADRIEDRPRSPFEEEVILVQSKGMERWISMNLARRFGIWANARYPFPNAFVNELFQTILPDVDEETGFRPRYLRWNLFELIPRLLDRAAFVTLSEYLDGSDQSLKLYQLSSHIADLFDQYLFYRPDMITGWERGEEKHWQAELWRALVAKLSPRHRAYFRERFIERLESGDFPRPGLPKRISLFGISVLPPYHLSIISALSKNCEVNLFLMNPTRGYWADIASDREIARRTVRNKQIYTARELHYEQRNSLLASMGKIGQEFFELVDDIEAADLIDVSEAPAHRGLGPMAHRDPSAAARRRSGFSHPRRTSAELSRTASAGNAAPRPRHLLADIQSDIFDLREPERDDLHILAPEDRSIQIHNCHSPMREVEVLHDRLLGFFDADPNLRAEDILVMAPAIDTYAPFIHAVFDDTSLTRIPYNISDRNVVGESQIIGAFFSLLSLPESRYNVLNVMDILGSEPLRCKLELSESDLSRIKKWFLDTRIKWAVDGRNRGQLGFPADDQNTWFSGLSRLLLGYAISDADLYRDILPYTDVGGIEDTRILGTVVTFMQRLFEYGEQLTQPHSLGEWSGILSSMLSEFFNEDGGTVREIGTIRNCIDALLDVQQSSDVSTPVKIDIIRTCLKTALSNQILHFGFLSGGVTFCSMLPMRSIPFKVICLLGMNESDFPGTTETLGFDRMAENRRIGDRSKTLDDRYLFLETLLSAREVLYISYVGQNIRSGSPIAPSVLVSGLIDYVDRNAECSQKGADEKPSEGLIVMHPLQAFSERYFREEPTPATLSGQPDPVPNQRAGSPGVPRLFSYSRANFDGAKALMGGREEERPFVATGISPQEEALKAVDLTDLSRFFQHPVKYFLRNRLGVRLEIRSDVVDPREPFTLSGLESYSLAQELLDRAEGDEDLLALFPKIKARGILPHGTAGSVVYRELVRDIKSFLHRFRSLDRGSYIGVKDLELTLGDFRVTGRLELWENGLFTRRFAKAKANDEIALWICHLAFSAARQSWPDNASIREARSTFLARDKALRFKEVDEPEGLLSRLLDIYWSGLRFPVAFFPETSLCFCRRIFSNAPREKALRAAEGKWLGDFVRGEGDDPYYRRIYGATPPLGTDFQDTAQTILMPLLNHSIKGRGP